MQNCSIAQIRSMLNGVCRSVETAEGLWLTRFTEAQEAALRLEDAQKNSGRWLRASASAGMTLDFVTDATAFALDCLCKIGSSQKRCAVDILVDGVLFAHELVRDETEAEFHLSVDLPQGEKRITVFFPNLFGTTVQRVALSENARFSPMAYDRTVLFLGDSITQGYTTDFSSITYANLTAYRLKARVLNQAIGGDEFCADRLAPLPNFSPETVFVAYGTNDWSHRADLSHSTPAYFQCLRALFPKAEIICILPIWRKDIPEKEAAGWMPFAQARAIIRENAVRFADATVMESFDFVPHFSDFFTDAYLHPNELGATLFAEHLQAALNI